MNGIELLEEIKSGNVKANTIVEVKKDNEIVCYLKITDTKEIKWKANKFKLSMLVNDSYIFNLIDLSNIQEVIKTYNIKDNQINDIMKYIELVIYNL